MFEAEINLISTNNTIQDTENMHYFTSTSIILVYTESVWSADLRLANLGSEEVRSRLKVPRRDSKVCSLSFFSVSPKLFERPEKRGYMTDVWQN